MLHSKTCTAFLLASILSCQEEASDNVRSARSGLLSTGASTDRLKVLAFNAHLADTLILTNTIGAILQTQDAIQECHRIVDAIKDAASRGEHYDVIGFQEIWDGRDCIIRELASLYEFYAGDMTDRDVLTTGQGSGLLILSKLPFEALPIAHWEADIYRYYSSNGGVRATDYVEGNIQHREQSTIAAYGHVNTVVFDDANSPDSLAGKGVMHVRVKKGIVNYDLMLSHTQAGSSGDDREIRDSQFSEIGSYVEGYLPLHTGSLKTNSLILMGDLNVQGLTSELGGCSIASSCAAMNNSEYGQGIRGKLGDIDGFYDAWWTTSPKDLGITYANSNPTQRLDYFLIDGTSYGENNPLSITAQASKYNFPQWVRTTMSSVGSDHNAVALDIGPSGANACPATAAIVNTTLASLSFSFDRPGSNVWYHLTESATYSVYIREADDQKTLQASLFPEDDLGRRLEPSSSFGIRRAENPCLPLGTCPSVANTYAGGSKPLYLRLNDRIGNLVGSSGIHIVRHNCSSMNFACEPQAGGPFQPVNQNPVGTAIDPNFSVGYFVMQTVPVVGNGTQAVRLKWEPPQRPLPSDKLFLTVELRTGSFNGPIENTLTGSVSIFSGSFFEFDVPGERFIRVTAVSSRAGMPYKFGWDTDASWLMDRDGRALTSNVNEAFVRLDAYCEAESAGLGSDEASLHVALDGQEVSYSYRDDLDATESIAPIVLPRAAFKTGVTLTAREWVGGYGGAIDNVGTATVAPLARTIPEQKNQRKLITADGLRLYLNYSLSHGVVP